MFFLSLFCLCFVCPSFPPVPLHPAPLTTLHPDPHHLFLPHPSPAVPALIPPSPLPVAPPPFLFPNISLPPLPSCFPILLFLYLFQLLLLACPHGLHVYLFSSPVPHHQFLLRSPIQSHLLISPHLFILLILPLKILSLLFRTTSFSPSSTYSPILATSPSFFSTSTT